MYLAHYQMTHTVRNRITPGEEVVQWFADGPEGLTGMPECSRRSGEPCAAARSDPQSHRTDVTDAAHAN
jgi:hypothetical protein